MGIDWEEALGAQGADLADVYDEQTSDHLYQDHPTAASPNGQVDPGDEPIDLPFDEV